MRQVGKRIESLRKDSGLTRNELAQAINCKPSVLRDLEYGVRVKEMAYLLPNIARYFEVSIGALFGMESGEMHVQQTAQEIERLSRRLVRMIDDQ